MEFLLSPPTPARRPGVQQPGVGLREAYWKPRPAASGLRGCGRALGLCGRLQRCPGRGHTCRALACLCSARLLPLRPCHARPGARAEPGPPSRVCLLVPKSTSSQDSVLRASSRAHGPVRVPASSPQPRRPKAGCDLTASGSSGSDPSPLGGAGWGHEGQVSSGRPCALAPSAPATGPLHPEWAGQLRTRGGGAEAQKDTLGKPGTRDAPHPSPPPPLTSNGGRALPRSSRRLGGRGCRCASWAPRASNVLPTLPGPHARPQRMPGRSRGGSAPEGRTSAAEAF